MLSLKIDENLKQMGIAREVVNKVQKLRKTAKLNIDDNVEIFYEHSTETVFEQVILRNAETIKVSVKVPFLHFSNKQSHYVQIA